MLGLRGVRHELVHDRGQALREELHARRVGVQRVGHQLRQDLHKSNTLYIGDRHCAKSSVPAALGCSASGTSSGRICTLHAHSYRGALADPEQAEEGRSLPGAGDGRRGCSAAERPGGAAHDNSLCSTEDAAS